MADAEKAELTKGKNAHSWRHYPRNTLFARALTNGARWYAADVGNGVAMYTREELDAQAEEPSMIEASPSPAMLSAPDEAHVVQNQESIAQSQEQESASSKSDETPRQENGCVLPDRQDGPVITPGQLRLLITVQKRARVSDDVIHGHLARTYDITSRKDILQSDLNDVLSWLDERGAIAELEAA